MIVDGEKPTAPSNDVRVHANVVAPPSVPANLLGAVDGSGLALGWRNTYDGPAPTGLVLVDVAGPVAGSVAVALDERFTFAGVPAGTYTFTVRATNAGGVSAAPSNPLTNPHSPTGAAVRRPQPPERFLAQAVGSTVQLLWDSAQRRSSGHQLPVDRLGDGRRDDADDEPDAAARRGPRHLHAVCDGGQRVRGQRPDTAGHCRGAMTWFPAILRIGQEGRADCRFRWALAAPDRYSP